MLMAIDERALTCKELVELVTDYLEGVLSSEDKERFQVHLATCDGCTAYLQQMRKTIQAVGNLEESSLSPQAKENLLRVFQNWKTRE
jgi:anti-sigma factor RsiW